MSSKYVTNSGSGVIARAVLFAAILITFSVSVLGQLATTGTPKEIFRDADGNLISNNEFVDLRLANPSAKDPATRSVLDDGTIEFRVASPVQEGKDAPQFEAFDIDGKLVDSETLEGKVVVLNFWFIGCPGCLDEIPKLNALVDKYRTRDRLVFISIAPDRPQELRAFRDREHFRYRLLGMGTPVISLFDFAGYPKNIVIGRDGKIVYWRAAIHAWDKFDAVIRDELAKK